MLRNLIAAAVRRAAAPRLRRKEVKYKAPGRVIVHLFSPRLTPYTRLVSFVLVCACVQTFTLSFPCFLSFLLFAGRIRSLTHTAGRSTFVRVNIDQSYKRHQKKKKLNETAYNNDRQHISAYDGAQS